MRRAAVLADARRLIDESGEINQTALRDPHPIHWSAPAIASDVTVLVPIRRIRTGHV